MTRIPAVLATIAVIAAGAVTVPSTADARVRGRAVAAGVMGLAAGAIIGSAVRNSYAYEPGYVYAPGYAYEPGYAYQPYAPAYGYTPYAAPVYGYAPGYYGYGGSSCDRLNYDRQLQGTC